MRKNGIRVKNGVREFVKTIGEWPYGQEGIARDRERERERVHRGNNIEREKGKKRANSEETDNDKGRERKRIDSREKENRLVSFYLLYPFTFSRSSIQACKSIPPLREGVRSGLKRESARLVKIAKDDQYY